MFAFIWLFIVWFIDFLPSWVKVVTVVLAIMYILWKFLLGVLKFISNAKEYE